MCTTLMPVSWCHRHSELHQFSKNLTQKHKAQSPMWHNSVRLTLIESSEKYEILFEVRCKQRRQIHCSNKRQKQTNAKSNTSKWAGGL